MRLAEVYALAQALIEEVDAAQKRHHKVGSRAADLEVALKTALSARTRSERCALDAVAQLHAARFEHAASLEDLRKVCMQCPLSAPSATVPTRQCIPVSSSTFWLPCMEHRLSGAMY